MQIPSQISIVDSSFYLDGGTVVLHAITDDGKKCSIQLNQHAFTDFYADPGRLYLNGERVDVRSSEETRIIQLLKSASIRPRVDEPSPNIDRAISKDALILGDDIREFLESSPLDNLQRFREGIVAFVESEEYVRFAANGQ